MDRNKEILAETNKIMDSFEGIQRAEASPFFYSKLMLKMEEHTDKTVLSKMFLLLSRPKVALGILVVFLILNAFFVFHLFTQKEEPASDYVAVQQISYLESNNYQP